MEKSIFSERYKTFLRLIMDARKRSGLTQVELARRLKETQSWVSKCERGERRIDIIELRTFCEAMDVPFMDFCAKLDSDLRAGTKTQRRAKARG